MRGGTLEPWPPNPMRTNERNSILSKNHALVQDAKWFRFFFYYSNRWCVLCAAHWKRWCFPFMLFEWNVVHTRFLKLVYNGRFVSESKCWYVILHCVTKLTILQFESILFTIWSRKNGYSLGSSTVVYDVKCIRHFKWCTAWDAKLWWWWLCLEMTLCSRMVRWWWHGDSDFAFPASAVTPLLRKMMSVYSFCNDGENVQVSQE